LDHFDHFPAKSPLFVPSIGEGFIMDFKAGDLIGFSGTTLVSDLINVGTYGIPRWGLSHVGVLATHEGELLLFESTTLDGLPCVIAGKPFNGVQAHRLNDVLKAYKGKVWHYPVYRPLYEIEDARLSTFLLGKIGTPYDEMGAFRAAGIGLSTFESLLHPQDLSHIFCSELCAAAYSEIGLMPTAAAQRWSPNRLARHLCRHEILLKPFRLK
jgi:hypothetical protein